MAFPESIEALCPFPHTWPYAPLLSAIPELHSSIINWFYSKETVFLSSVSCSGKLIKIYLKVDSIRFELNCRILSWYHRELLGVGKTPACLVTGVRSEVLFRILCVMNENS